MFCKAAQKPDPGAHFMLGHYYHKGDGTSVDGAGPGPWPGIVKPLMKALSPSVSLYSKNLLARDNPRRLLFVIIVTITFYIFLFLTFDWDLTCERYLANENTKYPYISINYNLTGI